MWRRFPRRSLWLVVASVVGLLVFGWSQGPSARDTLIRENREVFHFVPSATSPGSLAVKEALRKIGLEVIGSIERLERSTTVSEEEASRSLVRLSPAFPEVRSILWPEPLSFPEAASAISRFPHLRELILRGDLDANCILPLMRAPELECLRFEGGGGGPVRDGSYVWEELAPMTQLRCIRISDGLPVDDSQIWALADLKQLTELEVGVSSESPDALLALKEFGHLSKLLLHVFGRDGLDKIRAATSSIPCVEVHFPDGMIESLSSK